MDSSQDSGTTSEEESLETKLTRLNHNFLETLEAARRAQSLAEIETQDEEFKPRPSLPSPSHALSLRFPSPPPLAVAYPFDEERFSEDQHYSYENSSPGSPGSTDIRLAQISMQLEDALSRLSSLYSPQYLSVTESDISRLKSALDEVAPGREAVLTLGAMQFVLRMMDSGEEIALKYTDILEASEAIYLEEMSNVENQQEEMVVAAEAPGERNGEEKTQEEIEADWEAKLEEYQSAWDLLLEQRHDVEVREAFISTREDALKAQFIALEKTMLDLESAKQVQEAQFLKWSEETMVLKQELESLLQKLVEENMKVKESMEDPQQRQRRYVLEKDLKVLRDQAIEMVTEGCTDPEVMSYLDQAEEALIDAVRTGKAAKFKIRLSALRTKLGSAKTHMEILRHKDKAASINSTLEVIGSDANYQRSKLSVQHRILHQYGKSTTSPRSVSGRTGSPENRFFSPSHSVVSDDMFFATRSASTLAGRLSSMRASPDMMGTLRKSPSPDLDDRLSLPSPHNYSTVSIQQIISLSESRVDKWRSLCFSFQAQLLATEAKEKQLAQTEGQYRAWEKRLSSIEKELKSRETAARDREILISRTEDNVLLLAGKHISGNEAKKLLEESHCELQMKKAEIEEEKVEMQTYKAAIEADHVMIREKNMFVEAQWKEVRAGQVRLAKGSALIDSILRTFHQLLLRLKK